MKIKYLQSDEKKNIALVAHDHMKENLLTWAVKNQEILANHKLYGTGTTATLISERTGLKVHAFKSGPIGGDQQISSRIIEGEIDFLIFFWDPLEAQPHDPDVKALLRIGVLYNIPIANNISTANFLLESELMSKSYKRQVISYKSKYEK